MSDSSIQLVASANLESRVDKVFLVLSIGTLLLASVLQTRGSSKVVVPWIELTLPETCTMRRWAGVECAGCGLTRSFIRTAHGDVIGAWNFHPVGPFFFAFVAAQIPYRGWQLWRVRTGRGRWREGYWAHLPLAVIVTLMLTRWVARWCLGLI